MNCLIVVPSLRRAGAETQAIDLANGLVERGHNVHIFTFMPEKDQLDKLNPAVRVHYYHRRTKLSYRYIIELSRILYEERIEVVHGVMQFAGLISWIAARWSKCRPRIVIAVHTTTNVDTVSELADRFLYGPVLRRVAAVVFVCEYQKSFWVKKYPKLGGLSTVVYNGIDTERYDPASFAAAGRKERTRLGLDENAFVFLCVAGFRPEKGHDLLVRAFAKLPSTGILLLAGDGETRDRIERLVHDAKLTCRVRFLGNVADVRPVIAASDATILASTAVETFSIAMLESMAMATPMIAPHIGGLPEAIVNGKTGFLFPVGDLTAMADAMQTLMLDREKLKELGVAARRKVASDFAMRKMILESEQVLLAVVDQP